MPELPEVEITVRRLGTVLAGAEVESALAPGMVALKTIDPPLSALAGRTITGTRRHGKMPVVEFSGGLSLLVHLMSAGRLQAFDKRASLRDKASRVLIRLTDGRELRLREFGTKQRAWAKLLPDAEVANDEMVATLGPEAWPAPSLDDARRRPSTSPATCIRCCATSARSPGSAGNGSTRSSGRRGSRRFGRARSSSRRRSSASTTRSQCWARRSTTTRRSSGDEVPNKLPMPLQVHKREGEPCPRCGTTIEAVFFAEHQTNYCPQEQTGGRVLKDRRLSRLLK